MFSAPTLAQAAGAGDLLTGQFGVIVPIIAMFAIFYFLLFRPQQKRQRQHQDMVKAMRRGDVVVTSGGIIGKVTKAVDGDNEVDVEIAEGVRVKVLRGTISEVRSKSEPVKDKA